jgi:nucleoside 2-deoxyribosyltransferase
MSSTSTEDFWGHRRLCEAARAVEPPSPASSLEGSSPARVVYLAGPDVFAPDAAERFARLEAFCAQAGVVGLRPAETQVPVAERGGLLSSPAQRARVLFEANMLRLRQACCVLANLSPFRGEIEPDSGTAFEVGAAVALGKPVALYFEGASQSYLQRVASRLGPLRVVPGAGSFDPRYGHLVEDFGLSANLMLASSCPAFECPLEALRWLARVERD